MKFARRAMQAVGKCAINFPSAADYAVKILLDVIENKVHSVLQEAIVVVQEIFRAYPDKYESIIAILAASLEDLDEPEAKAALIWIIGQYADRIEAAEELLEYFAETFEHEKPVVQLSLLTALSKLYLEGELSLRACVRAWVRGCVGVPVPLFLFPSLPFADMPIVCNAKWGATSLRTWSRTF